MPPYTWHTACQSCEALITGHSKDGPSQPMLCLSCSVSEARKQRWANEYDPSFPTPADRRKHRWAEEYRP